MSSLYYLSARSQADIRLAHKRGLGFMEHKLERKGDRGNTKYWGEFHVCYGAKLLYLMSNATPSTCKQFLELSNTEKAQVMEKCSKALISGLTYDFNSEVWICPECGECEDKFFKKCECGTKFFFSERTLMKSLSTLKYKSDLTYEQIDALDISYMMSMLADEEAEGESPMGESEYETSSNPILTVCGEKIFEEVKGPVFTPNVEEAWTIKIGLIDVPLVHIRETPVTVGQENSLLKSTGFTLSTPSEPITESLEDKVEEAVQLALEVGNVIAEKKEFKLKPYKSSNLAWNRVLISHKKARHEMREMMQQRLEKERNIFSDLERRLNLRHRRKNQRVVRDKRGTYRWKNKKQTRKQNEVFPVTDSIVNTIDHVQHEPALWFNADTRGLKCATSKRLKTPQKFVRLKGAGVVSHVTRALCKIAKTQSLTIELIAGRKKRVIRQRGGRSYVDLKHMIGLKRRVDLEDSKEMHMLFEGVCDSLVKKFTVKAESLSKGSSGLIMKPSFGSLVGRFKGNYFIVRGRCDERLLDARSKLTWNTVMNMEHY
nr:P1 segment [Zucchini tigre mosaic virus]